MTHNLFDSLQTFAIARSPPGCTRCALEGSGLGKISACVSIRIVLESVLRNCDGKKVTRSPRA